MARKPRNREEQRTIEVRNVSDVSGTVNIAGEDISTTQTITYQTAPPLTIREIKEVFDQLHGQLLSDPRTTSANKESIQENVNQIQSAVTKAVQKNKKMDEGFLETHFRNIARMAPDILDVVVTTWLGSPLAGLGIAVKKIAEKAKAEAK